MGRGEKRLLSDPGSELRLGEGEMKSAKKIEGMSKETRKTELCWKTRFGNRSHPRYIAPLVVDVLFTLTHRQNLVVVVVVALRGHQKTSSNNSGKEEYLREKISHI